MVKGALAFSKAVSNSDNPLNKTLQKFASKVASNAFTNVAISKLKPNNNSESGSIELDNIF